MWLALWVTTATAAPVGVVDDTGQSVALAQPARRLITLAPHLAELTYAAGAGDKLVAVSAFSDYPPPVKSLAVIGSAGSIDLERLAALQPDLVFGWNSGNSPFAFARIRALGIAVHVSEPRRLSDIPRIVRAIGTLSGTEDQARRQAQAFAADVQSLEREFGGNRAPLRAFVEIWHEPLLSVNGAHMISDVLRVCGAANVFAAAPVLTPPIDAESLLAADPAVIIGGSASANAADFALGWRREYALLSAVQSSRVYYVHPDLLQRATPRILDGARQVCAALRQSAGVSASRADRRRDSRR